MNPEDNIGEYLRDHKLTALKLYMERSLTDIFRVMFNLDLALIKTSFKKESDSSVVHVFLYHEKATACVSLRLLRNTAFLIAKRAGIEISSALTPFILQDVACEMVSIISNNLRAFLSEKAGIYFEIGGVIVKEADTSVLSPDVVLDLNFEINPEAQIGLNFICGQGSGKPSVR